MTDALPVQAIAPIVPTNEPERLAALHRYQVLDTPAEAAFDRLTALAARLFKTPTVLISLVDESRVWFKSSIGFSAPEVRRNDALCSVAILSDRPLIVPDTLLDDRLTCNSFVQGDPATRFYAGAPLIDRDGFNLGALCLLDTAPHEALTAEEEATLVDLAAMVVDELELRLAAQQIASVDAALVEITQGVSRVTGGAFFDALVRHFAKILGADYVYIGLVEGTEPKMMRTIATCVGGASPVENRGNIVNNFEYRLQDTPCWEAIEQRKICCHPRNVKARFPNAPMLQSLPVESYIAIPFYAVDGQVLGLLGVMDGKPLEHIHLAESLLTIFASRIATELDRKQAEEELDRTQALVQRQLVEIEAIYQTAPIGLTIFDRDLRYVRINQRLAEINGIAAEDHIGRTLREIVPTVADENEPLLNSVFATGEPLLNLEISGETEAQPGVQRTWIENCYPLKNTAGEVMAINVVVQEITDRKRAEAALADRNNELTSFAYTVSHDLKAPLRAISNLSVWIEEDLEGQLQPDTEQQFQLLRTRVKRMESMIDSLLLYARAGRQEAQLETFDFAELLAEIIDSLAPPEGFSIDIQPPLPTLTTKRVFLSQVFANLISNAIKHHTSVTGNLDIWAIEHHDCHEFIIKDDGPGIAPEYHEQVFAIFQTLAGKDNSDSTGIGLAIVKKIVESEQGTIRLESTLGEGTTFYVTWPKCHITG